MVISFFLRGNYDILYDMPGSVMCTKNNWTFKNNGFILPVKYKKLEKYNTNVLFLQQW